MDLSELSRLQHAFSAASQKMDDSYCLGLLQSLLVGYPFLPVTTGALRPLALAEILNEILINDRRNIIEFGSGLSTLLIGRLIKRNGLDARILSVESDEGWAGKLTGLIQKEGTEEMIDILYAPLRETALGLDGNLWYDVDVLNGRTAGKTFDLVIVDGPTAWQKGRERARYPALPYIFGCLDKRYCIYLDDANRPGESAILQQWQKELGIGFSILGGTLAWYKTGDSYYSAPI
jgi:hypothetical protein